MATLTGTCETLPLIRRGRFMLLSARWTASAAGSVEHYLDYPLAGYAWKLYTEPESVAAAYGITLTDQAGYDVLHGSGATRSATLPETAYLGESTSTSIAALERLDGWYKLTITAGNADKGRLELWIDASTMR